MVVLLTGHSSTPIPLVVVLETYSADELCGSQTVFHAGVFMSVRGCYDPRPSVSVCIPNTTLPSRRV